MHKVIDAGTPVRPIVQNLTSIVNYAHSCSWILQSPKNVQQFPVVQAPEIILCTHIPFATKPNWNPTQQGKLETIVRGDTMHK
jgi:hypothetical protein